MKTMRNILLIGLALLLAAFSFAEEMPETAETPEEIEAEEIEAEEAINPAGYEDVDPNAEYAQSVLELCHLTVDNGDLEVLRDGDLNTIWQPEGKAPRLLIELPETGAGHLLLQWGSTMRSYTLEQYDIKKTRLTSQDEGDSNLSLIQIYELTPEAHYVLLTLNGKNQSLCELDVLSAGELSPDTQQWYAPYSKSEILLLAAHPGDEYAVFGGMIPYYAMGQNLNVQVAFMTGGSRETCRQALNGLWALGMRNTPVFLGFADGTPDSAKTALTEWGGKDAVLAPLVALIRMCKPEVIVSHNPDGEQGDAQHALTSLAAQYAVVAAADGSLYPDSAKKYGTWQAKKLYLHHAGEQMTVLDWSKADEKLGGRSAQDTAQMVYSGYTSLRAGDAPQQDTVSYGLAGSLVGEDEARNSLLEHLSSYEIEPEPTPKPEPTPEPGPAVYFSPEPTSTPRPVQGTASAFGNNFLRVAKIVGIALGLILLLTIAQVLILRFYRGRRR